MQIKPDKNRIEGSLARIIGAVKDEILARHPQLYRMLQDISAKANAGDAEDVSAVIPEYWNAENTSQRIADFALSFHGKTGIADEDFLQKIKAAIDEGFSQATTMLGQTPSAVNKLVDDTYSLTMKKLDEWASAKGIA
jgi:hypothetical protein